MKLHEKLTRPSSGLFLTLVDQAPDATILIHPNGEIVFANQEATRLFGYDADELVGLPVERLCPERFRRAHARHRVRYATDPQRREMGTGLELFAQRKDGSEVPVEISLSPIAVGGLTYVAGTIRDITEHKRAQAEVRRLTTELEDRVRRRTAELETANEELEAYSYSVSHDLRAPLRRLDGLIAALVEDHASSLPPTTSRLLGRIQHAARRMKSLVEDLLRLSHVGRIEPHLEPIDLAAIARAVAGDLRASEVDRPIELRIPESMPARGDPQLLTVVLENLLRNAWKYTRDQPNPVIEVGMAEGDRERVYFVRDNGVGFDMTYADKLFAPFQRLHSEHEFEGSGIGLATVRRVVQRHRGRIWGDSRTGEGAIFYFTLGADPGREAGTVGPAHG